MQITRTQKMFINLENIKICKVQSDALLLADYWRTLEICLLKYMNLIPQ